MRTSSPLTLIPAQAASSEGPTDDATREGARVVELPRRALAGREPVRLGGLLGWSDAMKLAFDRIDRVAPTDLPVLIQGASGTGKELAAQAIHARSRRVDAPFLALNCGALSATLIESELFGHVKGAFTGATTDKKGAFEACDGGTLFLDEIGELPLCLQPKLLRVLETMTIRRVGDVQEIPVDVRVVAATHRDLPELVRRGEFREDLFHRLVVLTVGLRPLRERPEDILGLAREFADGRELTEAAEARLLAHPWTGNVRELKNTIVRACVLTDANIIDAVDLELFEAPRSPLAPAQDVGATDTLTNSPVRPIADESAASSVAALSDSGEDLRVDPEDQRQRYIRLLRECRNNRAEAARRLGVARSTFHAQLKRLGIPLKFEGRAAG